MRAHANRRQTARMVTMMSRHALSRARVDRRFSGAFAVGTAAAPALARRVRPGGGLLAHIVGSQSVIFCDTCLKIHHSLRDACPTLRYCSLQNVLMNNEDVNGGNVSCRLRRCSSGG
jgi:hypothetical protein